MNNAVLSSYRAIPYLNTEGYYFDVDMSTVIHPHLAIDAETAISEGEGVVTSGYDKSRAVDGYINGNDAGAKIYSPDKKAYIDVTLPENEYIYDIDLWGVSGFLRHLENTVLFVSEAPFTSTDPEVTKGQSGVAYYEIGPDKVEHVNKFNVRRKGQYIRLQKNGGDGCIYVAEIAVNPRRDER